MRRIFLALTCLIGLPGLVHAQAIFRLGPGGRLRVPDGQAVGLSNTHLIIGSKAEGRVEGTGRLTLSNGSRITVEGVGTMLGTSNTARAAIEGASASDRAAIEVVSGGTIHLRYFELRRLTAEGLVIQNGATIERMWDGVFEEPPAGGVLLDLSAAGPREKIPYSINNVGFFGSGAVNIKSGSSTPEVNVLGNPTTDGSLWGGLYASGPSGHIHWISGLVSRSGPAGTFDTLQQALGDSATTASSILRLRQVAVDEEVQLNPASSPFIENALFVPQFFPPLGSPGQQDTDNDGLGDIPLLQKGRFRNCVFARGGLKDSTAYNCTLFDPTTALPYIDTVTGANLLLEQGTPVVGALPPGSISSATSTFFRNAVATALDFQLATPGGNVAIDAGIPQPGVVDRDFRGDPRPQGGGWDAGADEFSGADVTVDAVDLLRLPRKTKDASPRIDGTMTLTNLGPPNPAYVTAEVRVDLGGYSMFTDVPLTLPVGFPVFANFSHDFGTVGVTLPEGTHNVTATVTYPQMRSSPVRTIQVDTTPPATPANLAVVPGDGVVVLHWDPVLDADLWGYHVYRATSPTGPFTRLTAAPVDKSSTQYTDRDVINFQPYCYKVEAVDDAESE